jgi:hypothetical protein
VRRAAWCLALAALAIVPRAAVAQLCTATLNGAGAGNCSVNTTAGLTIGTVANLTLSSTSTTLTPPADTDYVLGFLRSTGPSATIKANTTWTLQISATGTFWTASAGAWATKPIGQLQWSTTALAGPYAPITNTAATIKTGAASASTAVSIFYQTLYAYATDLPGNYSVAVTFTLVSP